MQPSVTVALALPRLTPEDFWQNRRALPPGKGISMSHLRVATKVILASALIAGCVGKATNRATPEKLDSLLQSGAEQKDLDKAEERLAKALTKKPLNGLSEDYDQDTINGPQVVELSTLFRNALERNNRIGRAAQAINRAEAQRLNAVFGYLPQVSINASYNQLQQEVIESDNAVFLAGKATYPVTNYSLELRQPLFDLSRIYGIQLKKTARTVAEVQYVGTVQAVMFETFDAYLTAVQSRNRSRLLRQRMALITSQINQVSALSDTGFSTDSEVLTYRAELANLAADEAVEAGRYAKALADLSRLTGTPIRDIQTFRFPGGVQGTERRITAAQAYAAAEENNPALLAAAIAVVEGELGRKQAIAADFSPVLDAFARIENETREGSRFGGGSKTQDTTVGVRLTIPIFNASGQGYATSERVVDLRDDALNYFNTKRELQTEIAGTLARMATISRAIGQSSAAASALAANVRAEQVKVRSGESVDLVVLSRQLAELEARETIDFQRIEYLRAWGRLQYLTGAKLDASGL